MYVRIPTKYRSEHKLAAQTRRAEHGLDTNDHLVDIPGINHVLMSITGKTWEWSVVRRLDWVNFLYSPLSLILGLD